FFTFFFLTETPTTHLYTLSLHDALPISRRGEREVVGETDGQTRRPGNIGNGNHHRGPSRRHCRHRRHRRGIQCPARRGRSGISSDSRAAEIPPHRHRGAVRQGRRRRRRR